MQDAKVGTAVHDVVRRTITSLLGFLEVAMGNHLRVARHHVPSAAGGQRGALILI